MALSDSSSLLIDSSTVEYMNHFIGFYFWHHFTAWVYQKEKKKYDFRVIQLEYY